MLIRNGVTYLIRLKTVNLIFFIFLIFCISGCATILEGPKQDIRVHCEPSEGIEVVANGQIIDFRKGSILLNKKRDTNFVTFRKKGYSSVTYSFNSETNPVWVTADLIWLPLAPIAWFVDWQNGSIFRVDPRDIHIVLKKEKEEIEK